MPRFDLRSIMRPFLRVVALLLLLSRAAAAAAGAAAAATAIPHPTGPYDVGITKLEVPYTNMGDPIAPGNVTTSFLATVFYPAQPGYLGSAPTPAPYLDPATASLWEAVYNLTAGSLAALTAEFVRDAPMLAGPVRPTLLFGPGGVGPPSECYSILLSDLASHGYTVFGLDHPYEQPFVRYPNGTGLYGLPIDFDGYTAELLTALQSIRMNETIALIDRIPAIAHTLKAPVDATRIGTFGHSLGGAAAVGAMLRDQRIWSGINVDGEFWGDLAANDSSVDIKRPVLLLASEGHVGSVDPSWVAFPDAQSGWWRELNVQGSLHLDYSDETFWKEVTTMQSQSLGTIDGYRQVNLTRTFVKAFFDFTLLGEPQPILDGPTAEWPEVTFTAGEDGVHSGV
jgi:hypothetical protein